MLALKPRLMSVEDYLVWEAAQDEKWELVDGAPVLRRLRLMAGGTFVHSRLSANIIIALGPRLRGGLCSVHTADLKVKAESAVRYPDVSIDCGGTPNKSLIALTPRVLFEVLSPSTSTFTQTRVLADYQSIPTVEQIVFFSQDGVEAQSWRRSQKGWALAEHQGRDAVITLESVGVELPLAEVYAEVAFEAEAGEGQDAR